MVMLQDGQKCPPIGRKFQMHFDELQKIWRPLELSRILLLLVAVLVFVVVLVSGKAGA